VSSSFNQAKDDPPVEMLCVNSVASA